MPAAHLLSDHYNKTHDHYYAILERTSRAEGYPMEDFVHYAIEGLVDGLREQLQKVRDMQMTIMWQSYVHERFHGRHAPARTRMRDVVLLLPPGEWTGPDDIEPFSPELAAQGRGSARRCGKDGRGVGVARMGAAPPCTASDLPAPSRRSWPVRGPSW